MEHKCDTTTYQERIADNPGWVAATRADAGAETEIEDAAETHAIADSTEVHVVWTDRP